MKNRKIIFYLIILIGITLPLALCDRWPAGTVASPETTDEAQSHRYDTKPWWQEEFNGSSLNTAIWDYEFGYGEWGWGNDEWQDYTNGPQNISVSGGTLRITALSPSGSSNKRDGSVTSARIKSQEKFSFKYGKIQARIKAPESTGVWPAFWLIGNSIGTEGWPACGEIDIFEMWVSDGRNASHTDRTTHATIHYTDIAGLYNLSGNNFTFREKLSNAFHIYEAEWDEHKIIFRIDDIEYHRVYIYNKGFSEFHQNFYIILNVAIGGRPFWDWRKSTYEERDASVVPLIEATNFPQTMFIDWIRIYKAID